MRSLSSVLAAAGGTVLLAVSLSAANVPAKANQQKMWPSESISGTIMIVKPSENLVVVQTSDGVPFDMVITPRTRIQSGDQSVTLNNLSQDINKNISVRFTPEGRGDVARSIQVTG